MKEGFIDRHLDFVPLGDIQIRPDDLQVSVTKERVKTAPHVEMHCEELSQADESSSIATRDELHADQHGERLRPLSARVFGTGDASIDSESFPIVDRTAESVTMVVGSSIVQLERLRPRLTGEDWGVPWNPDHQAPRGHF